MLTNSPPTNHPSSELFDSHTERSGRPHTLLPMGQRRHSARHSQKIDDHSVRRSYNSATVDAIHPVVAITPSHIAKRRFMSWHRMAAEVVQTTSKERMEYRFDALWHMLAMCDQSARRDGETFVHYGLLSTGYQPSIGHAAQRLSRQRFSAMALTDLSLLCSDSVRL